MEVYIIGEDQDHCKGGIIDNSWKTSGVHSNPKCGVIDKTDKTTDVNCVSVLTILCFCGQSFIHVYRYIHNFTTT